MGRAKVLLSRLFPSDVAARRDVRRASAASRALPALPPHPVPPLLERQVAECGALGRFGIVPVARVRAIVVRRIFRSFRHPVTRPWRLQFGYRDGGLPVLMG